MWNNEEERKGVKNMARDADSQKLKLIDYIVVRIPDTHMNLSARQLTG
jgi:hypothetical protein